MDVVHFNIHNYRRWVTHSRRQFPEVITYADRLKKSGYLSAQYIASDDNNNWQLNSEDFLLFALKWS
jgi:hypothetical protein